MARKKFNFRASRLPETAISRVFVKKKYSTSEKYMIHFTAFLRPWGRSIVTDKKCKMAAWNSSVFELIATNSLRKQPPQAICKQLKFQVE